MNTKVLQLRDDDFVINQPTDGPLVRKLIKGETFLLSVAADSLGHISGETIVLGRTKVATASGECIYGYRLSYPGRFRRSDRRRAARATIGFDCSREVEIYLTDSGSPIRGVIQNVSVGGMKVRTSESRIPVEAGQRVRLVAYLPSPVGEVNRMVRVVRVSLDSNPRLKVIGVQFERKLDGLAELIDAEKLRRAGIKHAG